MIFFPEIWIEICFYCFSLISFRLVVTAWKPDLMVCTEVLDWHNIHCKKNNRPSLAKMVSGDLQVWQVTYSLMYRLKTASICFCWNFPFMTNWLEPSRLPVVPNSANKKANKCLGCRCNILAISVKLTKADFLVPTLTTWGGLITNFFFSPMTESGFLSLMMS